MKSFKSYCIHILFCPAQLIWLDFPALFRPLCQVPLSLPGFYEPKWRLLPGCFCCFVNLSVLNCYIYNIPMKNWRTLYMVGTLIPFCLFLFTVIKLVYSLLFKPIANGQLLLNCSAYKCINLSVHYCYHTWLFSAVLCRMKRILWSRNLLTAGNSAKYLTTT